MAIIDLGHMQAGEHGEDDLYCEGPLTRELSTWPSGLRLLICVAVYCFSLLCWSSGCQAVLDLERVRRPCFFSSSQLFPPDTPRRWSWLLTGSILRARYSSWSGDTDEEYGLGGLQLRGLDPPDSAATWLQGTAPQCRLAWWTWQGFTRVLIVTPHLREKFIGFLNCRWMPCLQARAECYAPLLGDIIGAREMRHGNG